jgi:superfamily I DNA and RNA helicase
LSNRRVIVRGGAGTGKTFLGLKWARSARNEGDRVLLTCYNDPLSSSLQDQFGIALDDTITIGSFYDVALSLEGMPELEIPSLSPKEMGEWWDTVATGHILHNWDKVGEYFDTIIIDEAQDFSPAWIAMLETLLDPDGRRRMLLLADEGQGIYSRGFVFPQADDGWVQVELASNFRNARPIAQVLRRGLGGAPSPLYSPEGLGVHFHPATDIDNVAAVVEAELERIIEDELRDPARIGIVTIHGNDRDELRRRLELVAWEDRGDGAVVCETFRRAKGLEFDTVILVAPKAQDAAEVTPLYIGVSRAVSELVVVGSAEVADRLGIA